MWRDLSNLRASAAVAKDPRSVVGLWEGILDIEKGMAIGEVGNE